MKNQSGNEAKNSSGERAESPSPAQESKCLDAGVGDKGAVFSLVGLAGKLYVHVNVSSGYMVFNALPEADPLNIKVNNFLADFYEQGREDSERRLSPAEEKAIWESDERPDDSDNPCAICNNRMPINALTAMFGCHYECREQDTQPASAGSGDNNVT